MHTAIGPVNGSKQNNVNVRLMLIPCGGYIISRLIVSDDWLMLVYLFGVAVQVGPTERWQPYR